MRTQRAVLIPCAVAGLGLLGGVASAQESQAGHLPCKSAQFSPEVLQRFPKAREACLYLGELGGEPYAVYRAEVAKVHDDGLEVRFKLPNGEMSDRHYIKTHPDLKVVVEGKEVEVKDLAVGQDLLAYVKVREPVMELQGPNRKPLANPVPLPPEITK